MASGHAGVIREMRTLLGRGPLGGLSDAQLLDLFVARQGEVAETAFEVLVRRHGPMVLRVCRDILGTAHDAEDAFQATFLVLARKAGSLGRRELLGNWLYGVAHRTALKARCESARRRSHERPVEAIESAATEPRGAENWHEETAALHEEVNRLPEKYRTPVVLCYWEGQTYEMAAKRLRLTEGAVRGRLARDRELLKARLSRRGLTLPAGLATTASAAIPTGLVGPTVQAAMRFTAYRTAVAGAVSAPVAELALGVLKTMFMSKASFAAALLLAAGVLSIGGEVLIRRADAHQRGEEGGAPIAAPIAQKRETRPPTPRERFEALLEKYDAPRGEYINDVPRAKTAAEGFLALAREHPDDPVAIDALNWVVTHTLFTPMAGEAMRLLVQDHLGTERLAPMIREIDRLYGDPFDPVEAMCWAASTRSPQREARGWANLALGRSLMSRREKAIRDEFQHKLFLRGASVPFVANPEMTDADLDRLKEEAARLFERVIQDYGEIAANGDTLGQVARSDLKELRSLSVGETAPEIAGKDIDGEPFRLSDYRGKVVVLTFSGNWCGPCRAMYPHERELVERLKDEPFALLSVNTDEEEATLRRSLETGEITWRCWWDGGTDGPITTGWNVSGFPTVYVLDPRGVVRYKYDNVPGTILDEAVDTLLKEAEQEKVRQGRE